MERKNRISRKNGLRPFVVRQRYCLDQSLDRPLAWALRRRLRRMSAQRAAQDSSARSSWNPEIFAAQEHLIRRYAPNRSFADIGCLWGVDGACAFLAETAGATGVTAMDKWSPTERYRLNHEALSSSVRFVQADIHDESTVSAVGAHDVVWCSGLLYHTPHPFRVVGQLLQMTNEILILGSKVIPSVPGLPGLAVYYPGLSERQRRVYGPVASPVAGRPFDRDRYFANWFWGFTPEALIALVRSIQDVDVIEQVHLPWEKRHDSFYVVFRKRT